MNNKNEILSPKIKENNLLNWIIGVFLILLSLRIITNVFLIGLIFLLIGIILLPPIARKIKNKFGFSIFIKYSSKPKNICPHCKEEINEKAVKCPHCQSKITRGISLGQLTILILVFLFLIGISTLMNIDTTNKTTSVTKEKYDNITLCTEAEFSIEKILKSPSTAKFPYCSSFEINRLDDNNFEISSYVDSQNGFGAMIRSYWTIKFNYSNNTKHVEYIIFNGEKVYSDPLK